MGSCEMKTLQFALLLILALAVPSQAQSTAAKQEQFSRGTTKVKIGAILMGAAVFTLVASPPGEVNVVVAPILGAGMGLVLWGSKERSDAMKPQLTFGASMVRSRGLYFSRRW